MATAIEILKAIRDNSDKLYNERVPEATKNNLQQVGEAITSDKNVMNTFISALINKVAFSQVLNKMYKNPLARLKKNGVPYGSTIEEIFINPSIDIGFNTDPNLLLKNTSPDGKACYYGLNRQSTYPLSISQIELKRAFNNEGEFMAFYNRYMTTMYSGDNIDEFNLVKGVLAKNIDEGNVEIVTCDIAQPKEIAKAISNLSKSFEFPSTSFCGYNKVNKTKIEADPNAKECITFCDRSRQALIIRADVQTEIDYEVLATMFHMEVAKLEAMTILVDDFPTTQYDVYGVLCDIDAIQMRDVTYQVTDQNIASNLRWNFWLHHWQYIYLSMFGNCVAFGKSKV